MLLITTLRYSELETIWLISILWRLSTAKQQQPTLWIWRSLAALCSITKECLSSYGTLLHAFSPTTHHYTPGNSHSTSLGLLSLLWKGYFWLLTKQKADAQLFHYCFFYKNLQYIYIFFFWVFYKWIQYSVPNQW